MPFAIRLATHADAPALARLRLEFRAAIATPTETAVTFLDRCSAWMQERLQPAAKWRCWVVEEGGEIAGNLWLQAIEKIPNPYSELEAHAYITNVYVRSEARGAGAGEQLVATALDWCRGNGVDSVILWPTARSRTLYTRHGFVLPQDLLEAVLDAGRDLGMHA